MIRKTLIHALLVATVAGGTVAFAQTTPAAQTVTPEYFKNSNAPRLPEGGFGRPPNPAADQIRADSEKERQREMDLLGIKALYAPRNARDPDAPNAANYDPALANPYPRASDVLREDGGAEVTSPAVWWAERRPEILKAAEDAIYGTMPANVPGVTFTLTKTEKVKIGGIDAVTQTYTGHVDNSSYPAITVDFPMTLTLPAKVKGKVPVIIELGMGIRMAGGGVNRELIPGYPMPPPAVLPDGHTRLLQLGWGYANYDPMAIQADNGAGLTAGIIGLVNKGQPRSVSDWGALRAWAWGASQVLSFLQTQPHVAGDEIGVTGHSRFGKGAFVAMLFDPRFAIGYISSSGATGAKLMRRNYGETIADIAAANEFHWTAANFLKYSAAPLTADDLPVDADDLIAAVAPRPIFMSAGNPTYGDAWVDAEGQFKAAVGAGPVYTLLGKKPLQTDTFPPLGTALIDGDIGFRQHDYGHSAGQEPNWPTFLQFAQKYLRIEK
jgi:hypothetical protein